MESALLLCYISIIFVSIYFTWFRLDSRSRKLLSKFPGPPSKPIIGNALSFLIPKREYLKLHISWVRQYGRVFAAYLGPQPYVVISDAEYFEKLLSSGIHIDKSKDYDTLHNWLGTGLLTSGGSKWHSRRKLLTPTFHFKILESFIPIFNEQSRILVDTLNIEETNNDFFNIYPYIARCALDIICETAMGKKVNAQTQKNLPYIQSVYEMNELVIRRVLRPWLHHPLIWALSSDGRRGEKHLKVLHNFTDSVIRERKLEKEENVINSRSKIPEDGKLQTKISLHEKKRYQAFLDLLLDNAKDENGQTILTDSDIREEVDTFMFEGHDTTAANLNWTLYMLAVHPEHQQLCYEEQQKMFNADVNAEVTMSSISQMTYLHLCIKESLRLFPSVPVIGRHLKEDCPLDDILTIPPGTIVLLSAHQLHRDPKYFPDPETFNPCRFAPENSGGRHPYAYVPFSAGPRNCIGQKFALMEEKVILSYFIRNFRIEAAHRLEEIDQIVDIILRPADGLWVKLYRR